MAKEETRPGLSLSINIPSRQRFHVSPTALALWLDGKEAPADAYDETDAAAAVTKDSSASTPVNTKLLVVDVRADDYPGGSIPTSVHQPFASFDSSVDSLISKVASEKVGRVVFYCMYSRERAPTCAELFLNKYPHDQKAPIQVCVLTGGFAAWLNSQANITDTGVELKDAKRVSDFDGKLWTVVRDGRVESAGARQLQAVYKSDVDASAHVQETQQKMAHSKQQQAHAHDHGHAHGHSHHSHGGSHHHH